MTKDDATLAGGAGLLLFAVQHNFEQSYASGDEGWDYDRGALEGSSFLQLPGWLNWMTANIGYHHVHHLSARIPSYCLVACHDENAALFSQVRRIRLAQVPAALKCILWDTVTQRIVSVAELQRRGAQAPLAFKRREPDEWCRREAARAREQDRESAGRGLRSSR